MDPSFAPAYAGLASVYSRFGGSSDPTPDELAKTRDVAEKALQLDPLLPEAHVALGLVNVSSRQWVQAEKSFRHAIQLDPNRAVTRWFFCATLLQPLGRIEEALEQMYTAEKVDPLYANAQRLLAFLLISARRYDEAAVHCQKLLADDGFKDIFLARARFGQGRLAEAIQLAAKGLTSDNPQIRAYAGCIYARSGRREEAEKLVAASDAPNEQALLYACLGDKGLALEALERLGNYRVGSFLDFPELELLRGDSRVAALRKKIGLPNQP
jgi:tetratricopeptide (TPR) repeat protein